MRTTPVYIKQNIEARLTYLKADISVFKLRGSKRNRAVGAD